MNSNTLDARRFIIFVALAVWLGMCTRTAIAQDAASFLGLGDLPGDPFGSQARGVSADGSVVVPPAKRQYKGGAEVIRG